MREIFHEKLKDQNEWNVRVQSQRIWVYVSLFPFIPTLHLPIWTFLGQLSHSVLHSRAFLIDLSLPNYVYVLKEQEVTTWLTGTGYERKTGPSTRYGVLWVWKTHTHSDLQQPFLLIGVPALTYRRTFAPYLVPCDHRPRSTLRKTPHRSTRSYCI